MVKIQNISSQSLRLKFRNAAGLYTKPLKPGGVLRLDEREHRELLPLDAHTKLLIKITQYNIHGTFEAKIAIFNPTTNRVTIEFVKSEVDKYSKSLTSNGTLVLTEDEFNLIKYLDNRLEITKLGTDKRSFIAGIESVIKTPQAEIIPEVETTQVPDEEEKKTTKQIFTHKGSSNKK